MEDRLPQEARSNPLLGESSVRVEAALLGRLVSLVAELVQSRNQLLDVARSNPDPALLAATSKLNLVTSELQLEVNRARQLRVGNLWARYPRLLRELALGAGKRVRLEVVGQDTEVDRAVMEAIRDPLTHLLRNAVDHGIESPAAREAAGKDPEGLVRLRAFQQGNELLVEIADDGAGISLALVRRKAVERGLVSEADAGRLSARDLSDLLFVPGFTTAASVTSLSGRGIGMDVVRTNVERLGGSVDVDTRPGRGTKVTLRLPLAVTVVPSLLVSAEGGRFALPQTHLVEVIRVSTDAIRARSVRPGDPPTLERRGRILPLIGLAGELRVHELPPQRSVDVAILHAGSLVFGTLVESVQETCEVVVKPIAAAVLGLGAFLGATVLGDGEVALVVDVEGLARRSGYLRSVAEVASAVAEAGEAARQLRVLVATSGADSRVAILLDRIERVEEVARRDVELVDGREVVRRRDGVLPLVRLRELLRERRVRHRAGRAPIGLAREVLQVVVYHHEGRRFGVVVEAIHDVVEDTFPSRRPPARPGVLYSALIAGRVTEVLDLDWVAGRVFGDGREALVG